jgi:hypothetical protein
VRVWFGDHVIADYAAEADIADRYAAAMTRRFFGLKVTNDAAIPERTDVEPLPGEHWWNIPPR